MSRALRRDKERTKQKRRIEIHRPENERHVGMLRHNHIGCGCLMCKPYKHDMDEEMKPSDRRRLKEDE